MNDLAYVIKVWWSFTNPLNNMGTYYNTYIVLDWTVAWKPSDSWREPRAVYPRSILEYARSTWCECGACQGSWIPTKGIVSYCWSDWRHYAAACCLIWPLCTIRCASNGEPLCFGDREINQSSLYGICRGTFFISCMAHNYNKKKFMQHFRLQKDYHNHASWNWMLTWQSQPRVWADTICYFERSSSIPLLTIQIRSWFPKPWMSFPSF